MPEVIRAVCPHDCPDTCAMVYEVADGKLVDVKGNKQHPITRGTLCVKLKDFHDHHANPDRLMYPLRRTGPKGSKQYERITWDEATFKDYIKDPKAKIPGTKMTFPGLKDPKQVDDIVAYLKQFDSTGKKTGAGTVPAGRKFARAL